MDEMWMEYCSLISAACDGDEVAKQAAIDWLQEKMGYELKESERVVGTWVNSYKKFTPQEVWQWGTRWWA